MGEHRYPRRWKGSPGGEFQVNTPCGVMLYRNHETHEFLPASCFNEQSIEGKRKEIFDHHNPPEPDPIETKLRRRCAMALMKNLIRELRAEVASLKKELGRE